MSGAVAVTVAVDRGSRPAHAPSLHHAALLTYSARVTDYDITLGLISGDTEPNVVIRELEEALSVFFEPEKTENAYSAYDELRDITYSLDVNWLAETAETDFEQACPHWLSVYTSPFPNVGQSFPWDPNRVAALGVAFAKVAISGRFRAAMSVEGKLIATTPGVPPTNVDRGPARASSMREGR